MKLLPLTAHLIMKKLLFILFLLPISQVYACDCKEMSLLQNQVISKSSSKIIIIGKLISYDVNNGTYLFQSLEVLKGMILNDTISGRIIDRCSGFPTINGKWIIYVDSIEDGFINFSQCGMSRSFSKPESVRVLEYFIGPPQKSIFTIREQQEHELIYHKAKIDLQLEIGELRLSK